MNVKPSLIVTAFAAVCCMSLVPVLVKSVTANEITIGLGRLLIALVFISPLVILKYKLKTLSKAQWFGLVLIGLCFGFHWLTYFYSIKFATASIGAIAVSTYGAHLLLLNAVFKSQKPLLVEWLLVGLCILGCFLLSPKFDLSNQVSLGLLMGIFSGFLYAAMPLLHQRIQEVPTLVRTWGQFTFALVFFLPFSGWSHWQLNNGDWLKLLALGIFCTVLAHSLWVKASTELPAVLTSVIYYLYVPLAMVMSWGFLGETLSSTMITGAGLIILANIGQALVSWRKLSKSRA